MNCPVQIRPLNRSWISHWTIQTLIDLEEERVKEGKFARSLRDLIEDMEDEVLANAGVDVFEEVFKLIFTKLYDEMNSHRLGNALRFRNQNTAAQLKAAIQNLFDDAKRKWLASFLTMNASACRPTTCKFASARWKNGSYSTPTSM